MTEKSLSKSALLMVSLVAIVVILWELYLRNNGVSIAYDDGPPLWADKRARVYAPADQSVVFIGSSRIKYDLDIPTWESITGCQAVQLAVEGSSPRPALEDLAKDPNFKGRLIIDVTEGLFFSKDDGATGKNVQYFHDRTPAQRVGFQLNRVLESGLVFLDKENFSLNAQLDALEIPSREGVFMMPIFPMDFGRTSFDRQASMTERFLADTNLQNKVKSIWHFFDGGVEGPAPLPADTLTAIFQSVKDATDKIQARGGVVLFVRTPSNDYPGEKKWFPRDKYWDRLLAFTHCQGIHFSDDLTMSQLVCPEYSHLSPKGAITFTQRFIQILEQEKGWKFPNTKTN